MARPVYTCVCPTSQPMGRALKLMGFQAADRILQQSFRTFARAALVSTAVGQRDSLRGSLSPTPPADRAAPSDRSDLRRCRYAIARLGLTGKFRENDDPGWLRPVRQRVQRRPH